MASGPGGTQAESGTFRKRSGLSMLTIEGFQALTLSGILKISGTFPVSPYPLNLGGEDSPPIIRVRKVLGVHFFA